MPYHCSIFRQLFSHTSLTIEVSVDRTQTFAFCLSELFTVGNETWVYRQMTFKVCLPVQCIRPTSDLIHMYAIFYMHCLFVNFLSQNISSVPHLILRKKATWSMLAAKEIKLPQNIQLRSSALYSTEFQFHSLVLKAFVFHNAAVTCQIIFGLVGNSTICQNAFVHYKYFMLETQEAYAIMCTFMRLVKNIEFLLKCLDIFKNPLCLLTVQYVPSNDFFDC